MQIVTRHQAKSRGSLRYFTAEKCTHGHVAERQTSNGCCTECHKKKQRGRKSQNVAAVARYVKRNPETRRKFWWEKRGMPEPTRPVPDRCECCMGLPGKRRLALDHCHRTGKFRGWLCYKCNLGIGLLGDTAFNLFRALAYLGRVK